MNNKKIKISINLTKDQYDEINKLAKGNEQTITDFVISNLPIIQENNVTLDIVKEKISKLSVLEEFSLPSLFGDIWISFSKRSRLSIGRLFYNKVTNGEIDNVEFIGKNSANLAFYRKIK
ncbi:MAG: single-stranded DNA-binding protein [Clostridia bacterium]|nr:single-stranded DNA-binding protein [Clostridia bacterium]MBO5095621.1 single-stranded DNA-binding protein [Bacilli bacterium]MBP3920516.1 single-stranded DNA-binding protein [Bacilli bacterium]MBP3929340.1 single-stranded DNA-binding protein [Peptostreptococcaceae bacterium]MBQ9012638.1 single-stranded DNA-binding protein [Bacilli bacterium]